MSVREYCLVPKTLADEIIHHKQNEVKNRFMREEEEDINKTPLRNPQFSIQRQQQPSLLDKVGIFISLSRQEYARSMLEYLKSKSDIVSWDEYGNLLSPIKGLNILEIIRVLGTQGSKISTSDKQKVKIFLDSISLPSSYIKNTSFKKLSLGGTIITTMQPTSLKHCKKKNKKCKWIPY